MSDARKTLEHSVISALWQTAGETHLTIDKCNNLVPKVIDEIFDSTVRWSVEAYLKELKEKETNVES